MGRPRDLERAAEAFAAAAGARRALTVRGEQRRRCGRGWSTRASRTWPRSTRRSGISPASGSPLGSPLRGVAGFRRSHFDAFATQRLLVRLGSPLRVARYEAVRVVALVMQDEARAEAFVSEVLGDLAAAPAPLRETLRTYLRHQSNATRAAAALYAHRNTVVARLAKAEALLPRPLAEAAFEVGVALEVRHWHAPGAAVSP